MTMEQRTKTGLRKLNHPAFMTCVSLLIVNDWLLKPVYGNWLTGKLSDFVGLFAFAFFISALINKEKWNLTIHVLTGISFIFWKSPASTPFIAFFNSLNIPVSRTIDATDLFALGMHPISFALVKQPYFFEVGRLRVRIIVIISLAAFIATSLPPPRVKEYGPVNRIYPFNFSRENLITKWNEVHFQETRKQSELYRELLEYDSTKNIFHFSNSVDTVAYSISLSQRDTIQYNGYFVGIKIWGNERQSELKVLYLKTLETPSLIAWGKSKRKAMKEFEAQIIEKIRRE